MKLKAKLFVAGLALAGVAGTAQAEVSQVTIAKEYGIGYLPYMIMEHDHLIEKQAQKMGLGHLKVNWVTVGGGGFMETAVLSGRVDFASSGVTNFLTMWSKTHGAVKSLGALDSMPLYLNTRNPRVHSVKDFSAKDKIAVPTAKTCIQAILLQMQAARTWGPKQAFRLDPLTVSMKHPDAMAALMSNASEVDTHFSSPPFQDIELTDPKVHKVFSSYDVTGPATFILSWAPVKFYQQNPKTYRAVVAAVEQAENFITSHKKETAAIYLQMTGGKKLSQADMVRILNNPEYRFTLTPQGTMKLANFMHSIGTLKYAPKTWKDLFYPNVYNLRGS